MTLKMSIMGEADCSTIHQNYLANGISAMRDDELLVGRPKGGLGILWKKAMVDIVEFKKIPNTDRACAIVIKCSNASVMYQIQYTSG